MRLATQESRINSAQLDSRLATKARVAIIRADYNREISLSLEAKCLETLRAAGVRERNIQCFSVPGCYEIPVVADRLARVGRFDVLIALGVVIRGETYHFDLVANECARGVMEVMLKHGVPIIFEVLAIYSRRDATRRAGNNRHNKGIEAARSALAVVATLSQIGK